MRFPRVDKSRDRLRRAGWDVEETRDGPIWIVTGSDGEHVVEADGTCRAEVWWRACLEAKRFGILLARSAPGAFTTAPLGEPSLFDCWACGKPMREEMLHCPHCGKREDDLDSGMPPAIWWIAGIGSVTAILIVACLYMLF